MRILDLFSGAGGAGWGYHLAGFDVVGVDIEHHDYRPGEFYQLDAVEALDMLLADGMFDGIRIDAVHASPPCQRWSTATADPERHPDLITPVRERLIAWGGPWVIENVPQAPLIDPVRLCGSSFFYEGTRLKVRRHRHFESNLPIKGKRCEHAAQGTPVGVYGDHPDTREYFRPDGSRRGAKATSLEEGRRAMGVDWMSWLDLKESIPPRFSQHIGEQIMEALVGVHGVA